MILACPRAAGQFVLYKQDFDRGSYCSRAVAPLPFPQAKWAKVDRRSSRLGVAGRRSTSFEHRTCVRSAWISRSCRARQMIAQESRWMMLVLSQRRRRQAHKEFSPGRYRGQLLRGHAWVTSREGRGRARRNRGVPTPHPAPRACTRAPTCPWRTAASPGPPALARSPTAHRP